MSTGLGDALSTARSTTSAVDDLIADLRAEIELRGQAIEQVVRAESWDEIHAIGAAWASVVVDETLGVPAARFAPGWDHGEIARAAMRRGLAPDATGSDVRAGMRAALELDRDAAGNRGGLAHRSAVAVVRYRPVPGDVPAETPRLLPLRVPHRAPVRGDPGAVPPMSTAAERCDPEAPKRDRILTVNQTAERLSLSKQTLYTWRTAGLAGQKDPGPESFKMGDRVVYLESEVEDYIRRQIAATGSQRNRRPAGGEAR